MHKLATELNQIIQNENPHVFEMLSDLGKQMYFPTEGILSQSAEAKNKAFKFNATIGTAIEKGKPMHLKVIQDKLSAYNPSDLYPYAPPAGKPELRQEWRKKMLVDNPALEGQTFSNPIVTNALTHGLSITADLFADKGDTLIIPDQNWENYDMVFNIRRGTTITTYPLYDENGLFNADGLREAILAQKGHGKAIVLLNFPNNPTGYTPNAQEGASIVQAILDGANAGVNVVAITDDAYFSLFFEDSLTESLFGALSNIHERVLAVKVDGATKEEYVWGFRVGFITFGNKSEALLKALEEKAIGIIRATISSGPHPSQTFLLDALKSPEFVTQRQEKFDIMKNRANKVKEVLDSSKFEDAWDYYPFNSGYFMCLKLKTTNAEQVRQVALEKYGVGTISLSDTDLRVAFSCIEEEDIEEMFHLIYDAVKDVEKQG
ncbi:MULTISPECIES: aminotransferase class I/II-fold pyridoxal phosphate-dependent enzyme [Kurthia]|uniref:aminotransferase class I/II-fold pyridoxal phosphate-dependent enzyme n=1 Tax=Kurthia TaxID=1649 RepID=UPI00254B8521|nr:MULTISPECIES: aminotransferase class I/II-fold pyridoxal phosphate-dependent enzyme [Kurthia]MEB7773447.1 aminotransferase class I/II-fold pyridoxal phosphate-dependent enzyme [Kurthia gibsonii]WIL39630.1 aminotransferase class I/II-fold pyridoxal phosphate-dependent enzyme [Kurthia sp. YJT4]